MSILDPSGEDAAGISHSQANQMPQSMRKEQRVRALLDQGRCCSAHYTHIQQSGCQFSRGPMMNLFPFRPWPATAYRPLFVSQPPREQVPPKGRRLSTGNERASDIDTVALYLRAGIDQNKFAMTDLPLRGSKMQHRRVRSGADNCAIAGAAGACPIECRFQFDLQRALGHARVEKLTRGSEAVGRRAGRPAHDLQFGVILWPPRMCKPLSHARK